MFELTDGNIIHYLDPIINRQGFIHYAHDTNKNQWFDFRIYKTSQSAFNNIKDKKGVSWTKRLKQSRKYQFLWIN